MTTKDKILMVSLKLFLTQGYDNTTLSMIADEVNIKKPSIYYHFKSKEDLLFDCIYLILNNLEEQIAHSITNSVHPKDRLASFFECILDFNANLSTILEYDFDAPVNLILFFQMSANRFSELSDRIDEYYKKISCFLKEIIVEGQQKCLIKDTIHTDLTIIDIISRIEGLIAISFVYKSIDMNSIRKQLYENLWSSLSNENNLSAKKKLIDYSKIGLGRKW
ncbi:AcrR family transcriptional regulator [Anaerosolibacter carboniphilus]|uniref:AcrR family transcriptional regulator n=1 Tax=Anaerosolibacter carboniphilus TaxID=1417629 RepID=A0A841KVI0_9FIRM|nr:TetR/AcrR family transcriptional regulator [Anaerosolibacter carboniphilus]MBB6214195.1 AcrR family transcriptional regulator [Anaerosolibacter carboniphilus]